MKTSLWIYVLIPTVLWACGSDERPRDTGRRSGNTAGDSGSIADTGPQNDGGTKVDSSLSDGGFVMDAGLTPDVGSAQDSGQSPVLDSGSQNPSDAGMPSTGASAQIAAIRAAPDGRLN